MKRHYLRLLIYSTIKNVKVKKIYTLIILLALSITGIAQPTVPKIKAKQFFTDESVVEIKITTDIKQMLSSKMKEGVAIPARLDMELNGKIIKEPVTIEVRGHMRKQTCNMPPLKINFKSSAAPALSSLGSLKMVNACKTNQIGNEYLFKEYLIYKMFNLITDKSFRARILKITDVDSSGK